MNISTIMDLRSSINLELQTNKHENVALFEKYLMQVEKVVFLKDYFSESNLMEHLKILFNFNIKSSFFHEKKSGWIFTYKMRESVVVPTSEFLSHFESNTNNAKGRFRENYYKNQGALVFSNSSLSVSDKFKYLVFLFRVSICTLYSAACLVGGNFIKSIKSKDLDKLIKDIIIKTYINRYFLQLNPEVFIRSVLELDSNGHEVKKKVIEVILDALLRDTFGYLKYRSDSQKELVVGKWKKALVVIKKMANEYDMNDPWIFLQEKFVRNISAENIRNILDYYYGFIMKYGDNKWKEKIFAKIIKEKLISWRDLYVKIFLDRKDYARMLNLIKISEANFIEDLKSLSNDHENILLDIYVLTFIECIEALFTSRCVDPEAIKEVLGTFVSAFFCEFNIPQLIKGNISSEERLKLNPLQKKILRAIYGSLFCKLFCETLESSDTFSLSESDTDDMIIEV